MSELHQRRKWVMAKHRYGLTPLEYFEILLRQDSACAICKIEFDFLGVSGVKSNISRACVDHDHITGKVRGILCNSCNHGLGYFFDVPQWIQLSANYLKEYENLQTQTAKSDTQVKMVLNYLERRGPITQATASHVFGCSRLASVIYRLRKRGHEITATYEQGVKGRFARYALQQKKK